MQANAKYCVQERRAHYRLPVSQDSGIKVQLGYNHKELTYAQVMNLSAGGVLCKLFTDQSKSMFAKNGETQVRIDISDKGHIALDGKIRRIESFGRSKTYDCAIQFTQIRQNNTYKGGKRLINPKIALSNIKSLVPTANNALDCLNGTLNYMKSQPGEARNKGRNRVYAFFENVVCGLSSAEQWWFYEVLDSLKTEAPDYSSELLSEYKNLYNHGFSASEYSRYNDSRLINRRRINVHTRN